jgi:hypothetical protein
LHLFFCLISSYVVQIFVSLSLNDAPRVTRVCKRFATMFWSSQVRVSFRNFHSKCNYHGESRGRATNATSPVHFLSIFFFFFFSAPSDQFVCLVTKQARNLQWLDLSNAPFLSDTGLSFVVNHAPRIRRLSLGSELNNVTDRGVTRLCTLSHLDGLFFPSLPALSNKGLAAIANVTSLTALELGHVYIANDAGFVKLTALTNLVELRIAHCPQLSDGAVGPLHVAAHRATARLVWLVRVDLALYRTALGALAQSAARRHCRLRPPHTVARSLAAAAVAARARRQQRSARGSVVDVGIDSATDASRSAYCVCHQWSRMRHREKKTLKQQALKRTKQV